MSRPEKQIESRPTQQVYVSREGEIELTELVGAIWQGKWLIVCISAVFAVSSIYYALSIPDKYQSTAILMPASTSSSSSLSKLAGKFGGVASLAGISIGSAAYSQVINRRFGAIHGSIKYLNYGSLIEADENGLETGTFKASDVAISFGYAVNLPWTNIYMGLNGNLLIPESVILFQMVLLQI